MERALQNSDASPSRVRAPSPSATITALGTPRAGECGFDIRLSYRGGRLQQVEAQQQVDISEGVTRVCDMQLALQSLPPGREGQYTLHANALLDLLSEDFHYQSVSTIQRQGYGDMLFTRMPVVDSS